MNHPSSTRPLTRSMLAGAIAVIMLCAAGCSSTADVGSAADGRQRTPEAITGKLWQWEETVTPVEKIVSPSPGNYTLQLQADGRASVRFDCNRGGGSFRISEPGRIAFGPLATTMMACPPGSQAHRFGKDLGQVGSFFVENGMLYLELPVDSGTMRFRAAP